MTGARLEGRDEQAVLRAARTGDERAFARLTSPYRRELHVHCYRMLGSPHDADDAVQETLLRAWRRLPDFEGRSALRTWLHRIATNVCLNLLERSPSDLAPYPDRLLERAAEGDGPEQRVELAERVELAFVTTLRLLPARQRAALVLREALDLSAPEIAALLGTTPAAVNSALQRARATLAQPPVPSHQASAEDERAVVAAFLEAWAAVDLDALVALLVEDAVLTMPSERVRVGGRDDIGTFFATEPAGGDLGRIRLVETRANGRPGFACYLRGAEGGEHEAYGIMLLTLRGPRIAAITGFPGADAFAAFGPWLPASG